MSSDPKECRANAERCASVAEEFTDDELKGTLRQTARGCSNLGEPIGKPMHHVATMPVAGAVGRKTTLFHCESCDQLTWIEE